VTYRQAYTAKVGRHRAAMESVEAQLDALRTGKLFQLR
jgi:hypothetical protein